MNTETSSLKDSGVTWLTLLASTGTLVCCALPILFVSLGLGATLASLTSAVPFLITLSQHKIWVFGFAALMLSVSGWLLYRPGRACPIDPIKAQACATAMRWNKRIYWFSVVIGIVGFCTAFLAVPFMELFE